MTFVKNGHCAECGKWRAGSLPETGVIWFHQNDLQDLEDLDFIGLTFRPETYPYMGRFESSVISCRRPSFFLTGRTDLEVRCSADIATTTSLAVAAEHLTNREPRYEYGGRFQSW